MRVLISGGGIDGLRLANTLHQHGFASVVIKGKLIAKMRAAL